MRLRAQTPGGSKVCRIASTASTSLRRCTEFFGDRVEIAGEIAGLVHHIDQILADHAAAPDRRSPAPSARRDDRPASSRPKRKLRDCSLRRSRRRRRRPTIPNRPAAAPRPARGCSPHRRETHFRARCRAPVPSSCGSSPGRLAHPVAPWRRHPSPLSGGAASAAAAAHRPRCALQQRIALELALDIGREVEIGELQQLDGLHQLRRHHQRLALAKSRVFAKAPSEVRPNWSDSCFIIAGRLHGRYAIEQRRSLQNCAR